MKGKYLEVPEFEGNCPDGCFPHRGNHTILRAINPAMFTCHRQDVVGSIDHAEVGGFSMWVVQLGPSTWW